MILVSTETKYLTNLKMMNAERLGNLAMSSSWLAGTQKGLLREV
jgi:hypothetical protein